jgi:hypothetical protein
VNDKRQRLISNAVFQRYASMAWNGKKSENKRRVTKCNPQIGGGDSVGEIHIEILRVNLIISLSHPRQKNFWNNLFLALAFSFHPLIFSLTLKQSVKK